MSKQQESEQNIANFSGNWPEDFGSENGNYMNACQDCGRHFLGHKRRFTCRLCWLAKTNPDNYDTPTPATPSADEPKIDFKGFDPTIKYTVEDLKTAGLPAPSADDEIERTIRRLINKHSTATLSGPVVEIHDAMRDLALSIIERERGMLASVLFPFEPTINVIRELKERCLNAEAALVSHANEREVNIFDREALGQIVRQVWIAWAKQQPNPKASWLVEWDGLNEPDKEVDRQIGETIAGFTNRQLRNRVEDQNQTLSTLQAELATAQKRNQQLSECLERGKAPAIMDGLFREAERLGFYVPTGEHALTQFTEHIETLRSQLTEAQRKLKNATEWCVVKDKELMEFGAQLTEANAKLAEERQERKELARQLLEIQHRSPHE